MVLCAASNPANRWRWGYCLADQWEQISRRFPAAAGFFLFPRANFFSVPRLSVDFPEKT